MNPWDALAITAIWASIYGIARLFLKDNSETEISFGVIAVIFICATLATCSILPDHESHIHVESTK